MEERGSFSSLSSSFVLKSTDYVRLTSSEGLLLHDFQDLSSSSSPITFTVLFSSLVAVCGSYVYGHSVGYSSPAQDGILEDLHITTAQYTVFSSILTIGAMLGAILSGRVADFLGRRFAMGISQAICMFGWLCITLTKDALWLDIGRFVIGCGIGLISYSVPIYVAEITPRHVRGMFTALNPLMMGLGQSLAFLIGPLINWRLLAFIGVIPGIIQLPCLFFIPESPRWLAKINRTKAFEASLQRLRGDSYDISQEVTEIKDYTEYLQQISGDGIFNLFQRKYTPSLIVGVGLIIFQRLSGVYGFLFYASTIFKSAGFSSRIGTIIAGIVQVITTTLGLILIDMSGRRPLLLVSTIGACLGCFITALAFIFKNYDVGTTITAAFGLIGVVGYLGFLQLGLGGIPWIIMSEIFPINIKGPAGSLVILVSWAGSWAVSYTFESMFEWSSAGTFFIYGAICALGVLFIAKMVPETKGRTLEEIQVSMMGEEE